MEDGKQRLRIGNYVMGRTIGRGTFAKVKEGIHSITSEAVAIKILDKTKIEDDDDKQRILR
jgi:serine/threonine protein kinase